MDRCIAFAPKILPVHDSFLPEGRSCPGCGQALAIRLISKAIGHHYRFPYGAVVPAVQVAALPQALWNIFGKNQRSISDRRHKPFKNPTLIAAESGTAKDLLPLLQNAASARKKLRIVCLFNEAGIERHGQQHSTSVHPDETKHFLDRIEYFYGLLETVRRMGLPFMATATAAHPFDLIAKVEQMLESPGASFLGILASCPTGCRYPAAQARQALRRAVQTGFFPLYTLSHGRMILQTSKPRQPVEHYLKMHHAFLSVHQDTVAAVQHHVDAYQQLLTSETVQETQDSKVNRTDP